MNYSTLISTNTLKEIFNRPEVVIVDCRFALDDTDWGYREYLKGHIPGAYYAHLDHDLSGVIIPGKTGRHPLPDPLTFARLLDSWGVDQNSRIIAYDDAGGKIAGRLWWLMRWFGHEKAAVLDIGINAWQKAGYDLSSEIPGRKRGNFIPDMQSELSFKQEDVLENLKTKKFLLVDSRTSERHLGIEEPIDPIAGHIPGAVNLPFGDNLTEDFEMLPKEQLIHRFEPLLKNHQPDEIVFHCGSGVTGAHNVLTFEYAELGKTRLYPGSWSEWITNPDHPIITNRD